MNPIKPINENEWERLGGAGAEPGVVYLVGAGPGDTGLATLRAARLLSTSTVVVYDALCAPALLDLAPADAARIDVGKRGTDDGDRTEAQREIEEILVARAKAGGAVVRLKGGDPFVFGRGGEEANALARAGVPFEVVPGVSSAIAAPAYAGIPVTHRGSASSVTIETARAGTQGSAGRTHVVLMGHANLPEVIARIGADRPAETPAAAVSWGTTSRQRVVRSSLGGILSAVKEANFAAPMVLVVGAVAEALVSPDWFRDRRPLLGRRILVTRGRPEASTLTARLTALGAEVRETPAIRNVALDPAPLDARLTSTDRWSGLLLTSPRSAEILSDRVFAVGRDARLLAGVKVFAIGRSTARTLRARIGITADVVPERFVAEALLEAIVAAYGGTVEKKRFLLPRAEEARDVLPEGLRARGASVDVVAIYRTEADPETPAKIRELLSERAPDLVTFTAASTVKNLLAPLDEPTRAALQRIPAVSIGPVTSEAARTAGFTVVESEEATIEGLVRTISRALPIR